MCSGYYDYDGGYTPEFPGIERFKGRIVHPQNWPEDLDYAGKRVVVIGSGATAVTLVPAMAETAGACHDAAALADLRGLAAGRGRDRQLAARSACRPSSPIGLTRWKNVLLRHVLLPVSRARKPEGVKKRLHRRCAQGSSAPDYDVDTHFTPRYNPWDQRLCLVPDGDLFKRDPRGQGLGRHRPDRDASPRPASS